MWYQLLCQFSACSPVVKSWSSLVDETPPGRALMTVEILLENPTSGRQEEFRENLSLCLLVFKCPQLKITAKSAHFGVSYSAALPRFKIQLVNIFCKGLDNKWFWPAGHLNSITTLSGPLSEQESSLRHRQYLNKWVWLRLYKTWHMDTETWMSYNFHVSQSILL